MRTIWGKLGQFGKYKDNLGRIRTIWGKLGQFGKYKDNLGNIRTIWGNFRKIHHFIENFIEMTLFYVFQKVKSKKKRVYTFFWKKLSILKKIWPKYLRTDC
jgi:hypothetical protein